MEFVASGSATIKSYAEGFEMSTATETQDNGAYANLKRLEAQGYSFRIPTYMDPVWHSVDAMVAEWKNTG